MAEREPIEVTVEIEGREVAAGTLWVHERGGQSSTFRYSDSYLADPLGYALDPGLPRAAGVFHSSPGSPLSRAFADSAPDRWGENLMRREERERARATAATPRTMGKADFLLGVRDDTRQGGIRFRRPGTTTYYAAHQHAVPRLIEVARLMRAADRLSAEDGLDRDLADLIAAGSSLGGARPKAAVTDTDGQLTIAKFPRAGSDEWDVTGWEEVQLRLAGRAGIAVAESQLLPVAGRHVLLVHRFDRLAARRVGFASALTMLEAADGEQRSYLEIAEVIERLSPRADADLRELYRRIIFSVLTANTDDHLRNHAFLRHSGGWVLSPAYDLNPNPDNPARLSTAIDLDDTTASIDLALSVSGYFRLSATAARAIIGEVEAATSGWRQLAAELGIPKSQADRMAAAYENDQRRTARSLRVPLPAPSVHRGNADEVAVGIGDDEGTAKDLLVRFFHDGDALGRPRGEDIVDGGRRAGHHQPDFEGPGDLLVDLVAASVPEREQHDTAAAPVQRPHRGRRSAGSAAAGPHARGTAGPPASLAGRLAVGALARMFVLWPRGTSAKWT